MSVRNDMADLLLAAREHDYDEVRAILRGFDPDGKRWLRDACARLLRILDAEERPEPRRAAAPKEGVSLKPREALAALEQAAAGPLGPNGRVSVIRGERVQDWPLTSVKDLIQTSQYVAWTCGPLNHDLAAINAGTLYLINVPHYTLEGS